MPSKSYTKQQKIGIFCILLRAIQTVFANINIALLAKYSSLAGVSFSVTSSIIPSSSFTTAILFYIVYREKLGLRHLVGMLFLLACILIISLSKPTGEVSSDVQVWIGVPILLALL